MEVYNRRFLLVGEEIRMKKPIIFKQEQIGIAFYHPLFRTAYSQGMRVFKHTYPNGMRRMVWVNAEGRSYMVGWFYT